MEPLQALHAAREEAQWRGMKEWLEDRETKWDDHHRDNVLWGSGMADMTAKVLAKVRVGEAAPIPEGRKDERNETAWQDGAGLGAIQHASATSARNISVGAEWLRPSGRAPSEPSETPCWQTTLRLAPIRHVLLHLAL